jgi:phenylpropionate dioxygenase-like ring-hydroxylating dioxygenase large terminal subunit
VTAVDQPAELTDDAPVGATIDTGPLGPARVPASRYTSPEWARLEAERMWPRTWQIAAARGQVAEPGDWTEYRCGPLSVVIVRGDDGVLRAFQNVCLHRGNELCHGEGQGRTELRCGYHRWTWNLRGELREIPSRKGFGPLRNEELPLVPVQVDTWGELVFVNLDPDAESLADFLEGVPDDVAWARPDEYRVQAVLRVAVPCNWKVAIEAFSETYHVQGIHREMLASTDDVNSPQRLWDRHGKLGQPYGIPSPRLRGGATDAEIWRSFVQQQGARIGITDEDTPAPEVPEGSDMRAVIEQCLRDEAASKGLDLSAFDTEQVLDLHQYNLFPNATVIYLSDAVSAMAVTPGTSPDDCVMTFFVAWRVPSADDPRPRPAVLDVEPGELSLGLIFDQDLRNLQYAQRGLHQPGFTHVRLSAEECRITNLHRNLERALGLPPGAEA